ncbi:conserved hypothetical protein [Ancylobacter novellus DSM 506]|uniref:Uncharacterized protein n=1 Tax=Ancylobacter novellus (strain ATCC 8093 / DSM 506 / JCM 20403 / CCM 1077 / IAM 12100 / NBRC 12443 / NCIMB 10456) TaxID=639283 RepID=D7A6N3_ANCN5|nr:hypothetical protein [Ancylobacter novellus]ADH90231.1 conserved hypothetical protein [Ancylobacter novellus DSM 506]
MSVTYYVALPFVEDDDGDLQPGEAQEAQTAMAAIGRAAALAQKHAGAIAFSRNGDPGLGEFEPAVVLARYGRAPDEME